MHYYIPAVAGNWQQPSACEGPLITACSFIFFFFVLNDHIFHCLNMPQNSPNLEYKSHLPTLFIIYCLPKFPPLGGAVIKESAFWLITPIYFVAHSKTLYPRIQWIVLSLLISAAPISASFFFRKFFKCWIPTFSNSSQAISSICTKLATQHPWTLLTSRYQKTFNRTINSKVIEW